MLAYGLLRGAGDPEHVPEGGSALLRPARVHEVVRATLTAMASGGLYDDVEGGFFRYATQRDWSVPHYEKMLEDNARLAWLYLEASLHAADHDLGDPELYRRAGEGTVDYLLATLWRDDVPAFGGSQDADETYYLQDAGGRADLPAPFVDPTVYVDWNALAARALLRGRRCSGARSWPTAPCSCSTTCARRRATATPWRTSCTRTARSATARRCWATRRPWPRRCSTPTRSPASGAGCAARRASCTGRASTSARPTAAWWTGVAVPGESAGLLAQPVPAIDENAAVAEVLLRLEAYTGETRLREQALEILAGWAPYYEQYGVAAAAYGQALLRYLERPDQIVVVGSRGDDEARRLHAAALTAPRPLRTVQWLDPADSLRRRADAARPACPTSRPRPPTSAAASTCSLFRP